MSYSFHHNTYFLFAVLRTQIFQRNLVMAARMLPRKCVEIILINLRNRIFMIPGMYAATITSYGVRSTSFRPI